MTLHQEAEDGNKKGLAHLISSGADVNGTDSKNQTPLHYAAAGGHIDCVTLLLEKGAQINAKNAQQATPLILAAKHNKVGVVTLLVEKGALLNAKDASNNTALHHALLAGNSKCAIQLLECGALFQSENADGHTPLHVAAKKGLGDLVILLLEKGAKTDVKDKKGHTPLALLPLRERESPYIPTSLRTTKVCSDLRDLVNNPEYSDITFVLNSQTVSAHCNILSRRFSDFFKTVCTTEAEDKRIEIQDISKLAFLGVLEYAYTGATDNFLTQASKLKPSSLETDTEGAESDPIELVTQMITFAEKYHIDGLKGVCEGLLADFVDTNNVTRIMRLANTIPGGLPRLLTYCQSFILKHYSQLAERKPFKDLNQQEWIDHIKKILPDIVKREEPPIPLEPRVANGTQAPQTPSTAAKQQGSPATAAGSSAKKPLQSPRPPRTPTQQDESEKLKKCMNVLQGLKKSKNAWPFNQPVDPVRDGAPDYYDVIKHPMDFGTIEQKMASNQYTSVAQFYADVKLVFDNAATYNSEGSPIYQWAQGLRKVFTEKWMKSIGPIPSGGAKDDKPKPRPPPPTAKGGPPQATGQKRREQPPTTPTTATTPTSTPHLDLPPPSDPLKKRKVDTPAQADKKPQSRELTLNEKQKLGEAINALDANELTEVVRIINMQKFENSSQESEDIEIDMNDLDADTLWKLHQYVKDCLKGRHQSSPEQQDHDGHEEHAAETEADHSTFHNDDHDDPDADPMEK